MPEKLNPNELTSEEKSAFAKLSREKNPPVSLEKKTVKYLMGKGLISLLPTVISYPVYRVAAALSVCFLLFWAGYKTGHIDSDKTIPSEIPAKSLYALFMYDTDEVNVDDFIRAPVYANWIRKMNAKGRFVAGNKLDNRRRILRTMSNQLNVVDLTKDEALGELRGYFLLEASDLDDAVEVAASNPHLGYNGILELREIETNRKTRKLQ